MWLSWELWATDLILKIIIFIIIIIIIINDIIVAEKSLAFLR